MSELLLGKNIPYEANYNPDLLMPVPRLQSRVANGIDYPLPFKGLDIWNAWEVSWLNDKGKPQVASAKFEYSAESLNIIESKSFKLYLNSLNQAKFASEEELAETLKNDLSRVTESHVTVTLYAADDKWPGLSSTKAKCIDDLDISIDQYQLAPEVLKGALSSLDDKTSEQLVSHLFKSNCMVTGQPDWASVYINYTGRAIGHENLLKYLISFRQHKAFHEPCVERIFIDLMSYCTPDALSVYCRYTRRGGIDINPYRSTSNEIPSNLRMWRQ
ncbi:MAG: NADPH-dependent 7-cyano-7-deazaguanine reductase QueF [Gammaproteobacteria bacterium]|nr:MAG: NADPH-dependent 7-cyano-7-deazaguanine reductase QueF [Gammaproteobacteria bacterium]